RGPSSKSMHVLPRHGDAEKPTWWQRCGRRRDTETRRQGEAVKRKKLPTTGVTSPRLRVSLSPRPSFVFTSFAKTLPATCLSKITSSAWSPLKEVLKASLKRLKLWRLQVGPMRQKILAATLRMVTISARQPTAKDIER